MEVLKHYPKETPINENWIISPYAPTPTIIEAARTLYESHSVDDITRHEADEVTTDSTIAYILDVIQKSKRNSEKSICFVTGVPGAGKTLVGLDVAVKQTYQDSDNLSEDEGAIYLSGNGPLVAVLNEALAKDNYAKCKEKGEARVVAAVIRKGNKIFATARGYGDYKGKWEFPGGKIELGETPQQALHREIFEELQSEIEVGELIDTIEYDYQTFHLSMDCYWCRLVSGNLTLLEAESSAWLTKNTLELVEWLPADKVLINKIKVLMR